MIRRCELNDQVGKLQRALGDELGSPELLPFQAELVEDIKAVISFQTQQIERTSVIASSEGSEGLSNDRLFLGLFVTQVQRQDLERVRYVLASYLRIRLWKLQRHAAYYLRESSGSKSSPPVEERLSTGERKFLRLYQENLSTYLREAFLQYIPENLRGLADIEKHQSGRNTEIHMISEPNTSELVTAAAAASTEPTETNTTGARGHAIRGLAGDLPCSIHYGSRGDPSRSGLPCLRTFKNL
ncbi:hypothetical protein F1559_001916 [Cyanidiococcus yangmingshanensis]|uniref:GINS subunit domain-containing protein n=1 Tax=Cyanidiococcus yangmingshanensis TaxID=2690220 RepID=A0A7J7IDU2_9RHOD|nr:hypothetical protein F1559_001916 [Cyanidiococcus yangmingshanensis]